MIEKQSGTLYGVGHDAKSDAHRKRVTGRLGENAACDHLRSKGFEILERNYRCGRHEIDIIAKNDRYIVFAEVKTRASAEFGAPSQAVNRKKCLSIISAATGYLRTVFYDLYPRFDVIEVIADGNSGEVSSVAHIEGAFDGRGNAIR